MGLIAALFLALIGIATLFVVPWVGAGFLLLAVVVGVVGGIWMVKNVDEVAERDLETPHMPGPGSPQSGVE
jgi:hypothetical protein